MIASARAASSSTSNKYAGASMDWAPDCLLSPSRGDFFDDDLFCAPFDDTHAAHPALSPSAAFAGDSGSSSASSPEPAASEEDSNRIDLDLTSDVFAHFDFDSVLKTEPASNEPFSFLNDLELQGMESGQQQLDTIKSDCMWSSSLDFLDSLHRRNRDNSLTLSECADSLFRDLKDIDIGPAAPLLSSLALQSSSDVKEEESDLEMSDEEIDVVSDCDASSSSSSTISTFSTGSMSPSPSSRHINNSNNNTSSRPVVTQAGRSLLRNSRHQQQLQQVRYCAQPSQQTIIDHMNGDHCYFALRQEPSQSASAAPASPSAGLLTPNESSDDEDNFRNGTQTSSTRRFPMNSSSIKQEKTPQQSDSQHVKFKFRMKFKSNSPQRSSLLNSASSSAANRHHVKRKSACRNAHCPSPSPTKRMKTEYEDMDDEDEEEEEDSEDPLAIPSTKKSSSRRSSASSKFASQDQKCREIRDLHNSMERQRRVDLRNNFDQLKDVVPELRDVEKASKLNILNKSAEFCKSLCAIDVRLVRERDRELSRRALLQKKLQQLMAGGFQQQQQSSTRMTSSGRMSLLSSRHLAHF